jgi:gluconate 5-dehydrogenase
LIFLLFLKQNNTTMIHFNNKRVVITGGGSGIGFETARLFCSLGAQVIISGRTEEKLQQAVTKLGPNASYRLCDHSSPAQNIEFIQHIETSMGPIEVLVNNAGIHLKKPFFEVSDVEFQTVINTNLNAVFTLSREVGKHMMERKSGSIILISSMAPRYGIPKVIAYTAAKAGLEGMTRALAVELGSYHVRVNCVAPGFIYSDMSAKALDSDPERKQKVLSRTPLERMGEASDVANAIAFLSSDAAKYITGVVLPVDGGNSIGF